MDWYAFKDLKPMLLEASQPFDSPDYIYEIKFDGIRCLCGIQNGAVMLETRRGRDVTRLFPELSQLYKCTKKSCLLDGELVALKDGKPDLYELLRRGRDSDALKLRKISHASPAHFIAFDIIFLEGRDLRGEPLSERKRLLEQNIAESGELALSRYIEREGTAFFNLAKEAELEGVVAKKKDSSYRCGKRSADWLKIKVWHDEDFLVCGYTTVEGSPAELILAKLQGSGQAENDSNGLILEPAGTINISAYKDAQKEVARFAAMNPPTKPWFKDSQCMGYQNAVWVGRGLACTVRYLQRMPSGHLRGPVFKGLIMEDHR